jgi:hypothetical protein
MKRLIPAILLALLCASFGLSQEPGPIASPTPLEDGDVVKISTNLIQIDVTVTDSKGKPIPDLRREEMEIYENGKLQKITNFSYMTDIKSASPDGQPLTRKKLADLPPPVPITPQEGPACRGPGC